MKLDQPVGQHNCPDAEVWTRFAVNLSEPEQRASMLDHAAICPLCAARLRDLVDSLAATDSAESSVDDETLAVQSLAIQSKKTRKRLARMMARNPSPSKTTWMLALAAILILSVASAGWFAIDGRRPPLRELASAYSARRNLELQIPGAAYASMTVERGSGVSIGDLPPALLESQIRIKRHLERSPENPSWLHAQGRTALLLWDYDAAIHAFQIASDLGEKTPGFLIDFASAYYERAERNGVALDYALALEKLEQALQRDPENLPALFNRAIIRGKLYQYDLAIVDFETYIHRATDAGWRDEARRRIEDLRSRRSRVFDRLASPPAGFGAEVQLESAMTSGIGAYFRAPSAALQAVANQLVKEHQDLWLRDVIRLKASHKLLPVVDALAKLANLRTHPGGDNQPVENETRFLQSTELPPPLAVWRDYELFYRTTRAQSVGNCGDEHFSRRSSHTYPWFEAQFLLESSLCAAGRQDFSEANARVDEAATVAAARHLRATLIRVPNFRGQRLVETGSAKEAIQMATDALATLESSGYPLRRSYDFQVIILKAAAQMNLPNTAFGAASMMAVISQAAGARLFEMIANCQKAQFALELGRKDEAARAYASAESLFRELGEGSDASVYWRVALSGWLELHQDRAGLRRMLREARQDVSSGRENLYFNRKLIAALCHLELQARDLQEVEALARPFWSDVVSAASSRPGAVRAYLPEIESISQSLTSARLLAGDTEGALEAWQNFVRFEQRLMGGAEQTPANATIQAGDAVLTVAKLDGKTALWLRNSERMQFHWAELSYSDLIERVRRLRRLASISSVPARRIATEAEELFSILFPIGSGTAKQIYIEARGELNSLPLATFLYAVEGKDVTFSFFPYGGELPGSATAPDHVNIVAATVFDQKLGMANLLPSLDQEVAAVETAFRSHSLLRGDSATAKALGVAAMTAGVLHFAGHAIPWRGGIGLVVAPDASDRQSDGRAGIWSMGEQTGVKSDLVVFSACRTGEFNESGTVRPDQLPQSALLAGANEVVATLWDVDSEATAEWMGMFYKQLAAGRPPAHAVSAASLEMRSKDRWRHPRYWAAFADYVRGVDRGAGTRAAERNRAGIH